MDGLECSEILLSQLGENSRVDAEYYKKIFLKSSNLLNTEKSIVEIANTTELHTNGAFAEVYNILHDGEEGEIPYIRSENVGNFFISGHLEKISRKAHEQLVYTQTQKNDILVARTGKIGGASIITDSWIGCNSNQNVVNIRLFDDYYSPILTMIFLNTKYGIAQFVRASTGNVQPWLNLSLLRKVKIPHFGVNFTKALEELFAVSQAFLEKAQKLYQVAFEMLYAREIEMSTQNFSVRTLGDTFKTSGRLDSEYYHPKYDALFDFLNKHKTAPLGGSQGLVSIKKSIEPGSEAYLDVGIPFIRVSDVDKYEISTPPIMLSKDIVPNIEDLYPKKDTILLSKDGSIGIAYKIEKDMKAVTSGALLHLTVRNTNVVLPDYLTLVLNSPIVQLQAERDCNGAIIQHWKPSDIEKVLIPILDMSVQSEIASKVQESFRLRAESKHLLDLAVRTVEMAIEKSEEDALVWLKENIGDLNGK